MADPNQASLDLTAPPPGVPSSTPARAQAGLSGAAQANPALVPSRHTTGVQRDASSARGYFIWLMPFLSLRYIAEGTKNFLHELNPAILKGSVERRTKIIKDYVESPDLPENASDEERKIFSERQEAAIHENRRIMPEHSREKSLEALQKARARHREVIEEKAELAGLGDPRERRLHERLASITEDKLDDFHKRAKTEIREIQLGHLYDSSLGLGSVAVTGYYGNHVKHNILNLFAETVAYDLGRDPQSIAWNDLKKSDNKIVHDAITNLRNKNVERYGTDLIFFGRHLGRIPGLARLEALPFGTFGIGFKALTLFAENKRHHTTTMFEDLVQLVDDKINPNQGFGHPITKADVANLYEKYNMILGAKTPEQKDINWGASEPMFERIATLMNETYRQRYYPAPGDTSPSAGSPQVDLALPKLIYLLGHGMIDPKQPERSMQYVDVASSPGIEALKAFAANPTQPAIGSISSVREASPKAPLHANPAPSSRIVEPNEPVRLAESGRALAV